MPIIIGAPANPYPDPVISAVASVVSSVEGIAEAHMPQWCSPAEMKEAEQVLVVVCAEGLRPESLVEPLLDQLTQALPDGPQLLVIPMRGSDSLLRTVGLHGYCQTSFLSNF